MSRQATATVEYFPHIVDAKIMYVLESKFGNDGYAAWFKIQELIGSTDGHYVDCRNIAAWEYLTAKCMVDEEKLLRIIQTLANVGAIDEELWGNKVIFCQGFINNVADVYKRRKVNIPTRDAVIKICGLESKDKCQHIADSNGQTADIMQTECHDNEQNVDKNPQTKLKETKLDETTTPLPPSENSAEKNGSDDRIGFEEVVSLLGKICMVNNQVDADMIGDWVETMPRDWIENSIRITKDQGGNSVRYVDKILQAWIKKYGLEDKPWEVEASGKSKTGLSGAGRRDPTPDEYERDVGKEGW